MRFESPQLLWLLLLTPAMIFLGWWMARRAQRRLNIILGSKVWPFLASSVSVGRRRLKRILQAFVILMMVVAWARPQMGQSQQQIKSEGVEVMLVADVSESMMAEDVRPNRLSQLKTEMSRLVDLLAGSKVGLVAFAGSAALLSPLTTDPAALKMYIDSLSTLSVSSQGTAFLPGLEAAKDAFDRGGVTPQQGARVTRVVVVASDGEDHEPEALKRAEDLVKDGTRVFALAYGTEKGASIPVRDSLGFLQGYKKDGKGAPVLTTVKGEALKELAEAGRGQLFFASPGANHLNRLAEAINQLEKSTFENEMAVQYTERYQLFLILALCLALIELLLSDRRKAGQVWKGRFEVPS